MKTGIGADSFKLKSTLPMSNTPETEVNEKQRHLTRLQLGEAFMHCSDCGGKLYSFDGDQDRARPCPHPKKCKEENERTN